MLAGWAAELADARRYRVSADNGAACYWTAVVKPTTPKLVTLTESNYRQAAPTLRAIADEIEAGKYGAVGCVAVAILGDTMEVFGAGIDSDAPSVALLLHAAFLRLSRSVEEHGREES